MAITTAMATSFKQQLFRGQHVLQAPATFTATTANTNAGLTGVSSVVGLTPGMPITGAGIPATTVIASIDSASTLTMSKAATASASITVTPTSPGTPKLALYTSAAALDATTTSYAVGAPSGEASGTNYAAGGNNLSIAASMPATSGTTAYLDFVDLIFSNVTVTARGCMIYNPYAGLNRTISVHDFGSDKQATAGDFTIVFPTPDATNAILRLT